MFKGHPRGLYVAFLTNMGERFGFYTMMAILVLFLQAKYDLPGDKAGLIYSVFYFLIYALALLGGFIADRTQNYRGTILTGIVIMFLGYVLMAIPGTGLPVAIVGLLTIALGNGLFKGNLQALVGQLYDAPAYRGLRDSAFSIFYMGINIGAVFAPNAARGVRTWYLGRYGFGYDADLPSLCNQLLRGELADVTQLQQLAAQVTAAPVADLTEFARRYIEVFSTGYNYAFAIAAAAMLVSLAVYVSFKGMLPDRRKQAAQGSATAEMPRAEERRRLMALGLVFLVVIFFWMAFHQNGLTLTYFARDYTVKQVDPLDYLVFDIRGLLLLAAVIGGWYLVFRSGATLLWRGVGLLMAAGGSVLAWLLYTGYAPQNAIEPEVFQQFNPYFVVFLTPVVVSLFAYLRSRGKEPSTPRKIGFGMIMAAVGFAVMLLGSLDLPSPLALNGQPSPERVSSYWLIGCYLILTVAELFLSPMGLSFVAKVAPPRYQGLMQGGWLGATALGNQLLFVGSFMWVRYDIWLVWLVFVVCCLLSAAFIFSILKRLEAATADKPEAEHKPEPPGPVVDRPPPPQPGPPQPAVSPAP
ncbi:MAG: peptide MFS transporter [Deltaproteobacteria bacterium]|nr:peptide MFS transporter [Deltaproteobacteria bacterium]